MIYQNKNKIMNSIINNNNNRVKNNIKNKNVNVINNNANNSISVSKKNLSDNSYQNISQHQIDANNKENTSSSQNKSNRSRNNINNTVTHNINLNNTNNNESNSNSNNMNKKIRISSVANTTNNTVFSTIHKQKYSPSNRPSKYTNNNNRKNIPINNKYNTNNYIEDINYIDEENYCDSNKLKNIPTDILIRLRDWLISCDLLCYYNLFIAKNMYNIDSYIRDIQEGLITITYKDIEKIGIKKPGHIFRILIRLEIDSGIIDSNLFNFIVEKINYYYSNSTTVALTSSINDINCCGINLCSDSNSNNNKYSNKKSRNNENIFNDLSSFLMAYNLYKFKGNFLYNGFDKIEYIIIQLFSKYAFNKQILKEYLHVYIEKDRNKLLSGLYMVKINIAKEFGIEIDEEEIKKFFKSVNKLNKYSNKNFNFSGDYSNNNSIKKNMSNYYFNNSSFKRSNSFCDNNNKNKNEDLSNNFCFIF